MTTASLYEARFAPAEQSAKAQLWRILCEDFFQRFPKLIWGYPPAMEQEGDNYAEAVCKTSYADKKGKYQDQAGLTLPFVPTKEG